MVKTQESEKKPKTIKITKIKKSDILDFRMDTIECFWQFLNKNECFWTPALTTWEADYDINYTIADDITIDYSIRPTKYKYKLTFLKNRTPILAYYEWDPKQDFPTKNYYTVYWKAWRLLSQERIYQILNTHFQFEWFRRLDIAIDLKQPLDQILNTVKTLSQKGADFYGSKWEIETHFIGAKKKADNRYILIRFYDKIKEIRHSKTQRLYTNYLIEPHVTRIEIEFREETCKNITWQQATTQDYLFNLFYSYINKHTKIFSKLQSETIKLTRAKKSLDLSELTPEEILASTSLKMFKWLARNFREVGICPVHILLLEQYYDDNTLWDIISASQNGTLDLTQYKEGLNHRNVTQIFRN